MWMPPSPCHGTPAAARRALLASLRFSGGRRCSRHCASVGGSLLCTPVRLCSRTSLYLCCTPRHASVRANALLALARSRSHMLAETHRHFLWQAKKMKIFFGKLSKKSSLSYSGLRPHDPRCSRAAWRCDRLECTRFRSPRFPHLLAGLAEPAVQPGLAHLLAVARDHVLLLVVRDRVQKNAAVHPPVAAVRDKGLPPARTDGACPENGAPPLEARGSWNETVSFSYVVAHVCQ